MFGKRHGGEDTSSILMSVKFYQQHLSLVILLPTFPSFPHIHHGWLDNVGQGKDIAVPLPGAMCLSRRGLVYGEPHTEL